MNRIKTTNLILKWVARVLGALLLALVFTLFIGESASNGFPNPFGQPLSVQIEFAGMFVLLFGIIVGWKWQGPGGILILAGNMAFHIIEAKLYINWVFGAFDLTAVLYLASWLLNRIPEKTNEA